MNKRYIAVPIVSNYEIIDQDSSVEEILARPDIQIYEKAENIFQDLNDEVLNDQYWFFVVDWDKKQHLNFQLL